MGLLKEIKEKYRINDVYSLSKADFVLKKEKIYLFYNEKEEVNYYIYTDGNLEHINTWMDKRPYQHDIFLKGCGMVKRFEFLLDDANFLLVDKSYQDKNIRNLYIDEENMQKIIVDRIYQLSITNRDNLKIKRLEK